MTGTPEWIRSQRRARGECELCGQRPAETQWGPAGPLLCWPCCEVRQAAYGARYDEGGMSEYRPAARPGGAVVSRRGRCRRRPRLYLRGHLGCLGCSVPLLACLAALTAAAVVMWP